MRLVNPWKAEVPNCCPLEKAWGVQVLRPLTRDYALCSECCSDAE